MTTPNLGWDALINAGSGVLLVLFGVWVATLRPRSRATILLAVFSAAFGAAFLPNNLFPQDDFVTRISQPVALVVETVLRMTALACLALMALWLPRPVARDERRLLVAAGLAVAAVVAVHGLWFFARSYPHLGWGEIGQVFARTSGQRTLTAFATEAAMWLFPLVLALRHAAAARAPGQERLRGQARLMSAALVLWPGVLSGGWLGRAGLNEWDLLITFPALLAALWLRNAAIGERGEARAASAVALVCLAAPLVGQVNITLFLDSFTASGPQHGLARTATVLVLGYAILRHRLLDLDVKLKWGLRRGTVSTAFVAVGLVVAEAARLAVGAEEAALVGIAAAGLLVFALARLNRLAERVAEAAMPGVPDAPDGLDRRRLEVYRAALEEAMDPRGEVRASHESLLARLRGELGVSDRDHAVLLHAVHAARGIGPEDHALVPDAVVLGRYRIMEPLGAGGQGATFLARDETLGRQVAVKAVAPGRGDADAAALLREARRLAAVQHPHVVALHDVERVGPRVLLVMEHVEGGSLERRLRSGPLEPRAFGVVADGLLRGLEAVHAAGIVHRDVKPSNVLLTPEGQAKLADFGVARKPSPDTTMGGLQRAGATPGTARYMAPEQARGRGATARSDLYSAAATLFEACTGKPFLAPERGESAAEVQMRAAMARPFARHDEVPAGLAAWFARALDPDPGARFASTKEARRALAAAMRGTVREGAAASGMPLVRDPRPDAAPHD